MPLLASRPGPLGALTTLLAGLAILAAPYIALELALPIGGWQANAPLSELCALALLPIGLFATLRRRPTLPAPSAYALLLAAALLSLDNAFAPAEGLHTLVRKPLFEYLAWVIGFGGALSTLPADRRRALLLASAGLLALISLSTSLLRLSSGAALWWSALPRLTPNHKTLAVALAGVAPLYLGPAFGRPGPLRAAARLVSLLAVLAILASFAKAALLALLLGAAALWPAHRPLALRPRLILPLAGIALFTAILAPILSGSPELLDALRSRQLLNERAWTLFAAHPLLGSGLGMSVLYEQITFPEYRINGVDAHGLLAKIGGEMGLLGISAYALFLTRAATQLRDRWRAACIDGEPPFAGPRWAAIATLGLLQASLLLSTECFSPTHWMPLALAWTLAMEPRCAS